MCATRVLQTAFICTEANVGKEVNTVRTSNLQRLPKPVDAHEVMTAAAQKLCPVSTFLDHTAFTINVLPLCSQYQAHGSNETDVIMLLNITAFARHPSQGQVVLIFQCSHGDDIRSNLVPKHCH